VPQTHALQVLRVRLFGGLSLAWDIVPVPTIPSTAARSLLAYLLVHRDRAYDRGQLTSTYWPALPKNRACRRLDQMLSQIGHAVQRGSPTPIFLIGGDAIQFNPELPLWLDLQEFTIHQEQCTSEQDSLWHCERCINLYQGPFLEGYADDWIVARREQLRQTFLSTLGHLIKEYTALGQYERALAHANRLAAEDPRREKAHQEVMRLYHLLGRDAEALQQYEICQKILSEQLGAEPAPETAALAADIASR
jgi:DNA-binding SARP family transcriptional activator